MALGNSDGRTPAHDIHNQIAEHVFVNPVAGIILTVTERTAGEQRTTFPNDTDRSTVSTTERPNSHDISSTSDRTVNGMLKRLRRTHDPP